MKQRYAKVGVPIEGTLWDLVSIGRDTNGNRTASISRDGGRAKSFQTGGLVQAIHNYLPTGSGARWAAEVQEYIDRDPGLMDELLYLVQIAETGRYRVRAKQRPENSLGTDMHFEGFTFTDEDFKYVVTRKFDADGKRDALKGELLAIFEENPEYVCFIVNGVHDFFYADPDDFWKSVKDRPSDSYIEEEDYRSRPKQRPANFTQREIEGILNSYTYAALWSSYDDEGDPLDYNFSQFDIAPRSIKQAEKDIQDFLAQAGDLVDFYSDDPSQIGHYFWLSRNHYGAGFLDDGQKELERIAEGFRSIDAVIGDDGMIYFE